MFLQTGTFLHGITGGRNMMRLLKLGVFVINVGLFESSKIRIRNAEMDSISFMGVLSYKNRLLPNRGIIWKYRSILSLQKNRGQILTGQDVIC